MNGFTRTLYATTIFLSSFLFTMQPMFSKVMLPYFGGAALVWITCILFYQFALLIGYAYASFLAQKINYRKQIIIHALLLICSASFLPILMNVPVGIDQYWLPLQVLGVMLVSISVPIIVISSTTPLLSSWYTAINKNHFTYYLYAVSNLGMLLGVMGYPLFIETWLGMALQLKLWSVCYGIYIVLVVACGYVLVSHWPQQVAETVKHEALKFGQVTYWIFLTFLSSTLLCAITQYLVQNVINMPLMWVIPLSLFLISYAVVFAKPKSYHREFWGAAFVIWLAIMAWSLNHAEFSGLSAVITLLVLLYTGFMVCHGELFMHRPGESRLTVFYLAIAIGGVLGGIFVNIVALLLFNYAWDFYGVLVVIAGIILTVYGQQWFRTRSWWDGGLWAVCSMFTLGFLYVILNSYFNANSIVLERLRTVYGLLQVKERHFSSSEYDYRILMHGSILHGMQYLAPEKELNTTSYYGESSGVGLAIQYLHQRQGAIHVGAVGLGVGTLAAALRQGDSITFYEIDPHVLDLAKKHFSFLSKAQAEVKITIGDARIKLHEQLTHHGSQRYDLMIVDAFGGDAIPFHLLTDEAIQLYRMHLNSGGIIALHTTNTYLNFYPLTTALAREFDVNHYWLYDKGDVFKSTMRSTWALLTKDKQLGRYLQAHGIAWRQGPTDAVLWTDDYNTILPLMKWR